MDSMLFKRFFIFCCAALLTVLTSIWMAAPVVAHALPTIPAEYTSGIPVNQLNNELEEAIKTRPEIKVTSIHSHLRQVNSIEYKSISAFQPILQRLSARTKKYSHIRPVYYVFLFRYYLF